MPKQIGKISLKKVPVKDFNILTGIRSALNSICDANEKYKVFGIKGFLPTHLDEKWESDDNNSCLTGNAQIAIVLRRFSELTEPYYMGVSDVFIDAIKKTQIVDTEVSEIRGALPRTFPFYDGYNAHAFPNWATKYFADALLLRNAKHPYIGILS